MPGPDGNGDPYQLRQLAPAELDRRKRELQADLLLYPAGTATRKDLSERVAAIEAEQARRTEGGTPVDDVDC